jgi:hypothetical protein
LFLIVRRSGSNILVDKNCVILKKECMPATLNETQLEILKLFALLKDENELQEIKSLLVAYLSDKVVRSADNAYDDRKYTEEIFESWKKEHFRKSA